MKVYAPHTRIGRTRAVDDASHKTADQPRSAAEKAAKRLRHGARQDGKREAARLIKEREVSEFKTSKDEVECACGHVWDEHGHDPKHPGSTECQVEECMCIAFEAAEVDHDE